MPKIDLPLDSGDYAPVAERIALFYARFPEGRIITELVSRTADEVTFRARVYRSASDRAPSSTGWASERPGDGDVNAVACIENTETSAIGRALANLGFLASSTRPSAEEMTKASRERARLRPGHPRAVREPAPVASESSVAFAETVRDIAALLEAAEREGLPAARSHALREKLGAEIFSPRQLERIERALRIWLARRSRESAGG